MSHISGSAAGSSNGVGPIARVRGLMRRFGGVVAVNNLTFDITDGEVLAVIGPNGAGKSTLLRMLAGQDRPTAGTIHLVGTGDVQGNSPRFLTRHGVALARQIPRPLGSLTVAQNVEVGLRAGSARNDGAPRERLADILELTGLVPHADQPASRLNLLNLKRLEVARALASEPRLLLLDEVSAGLSENELDAAIDLLRRLNRSGITLVVVEHVQRVIHELADRVIVLNWGGLLTTGTPAEVTADKRVQEVYLGEGRPASSAERAAAHTPHDLPAATPGTGLQIASLSVRRGGQHALRDVRLNIAPGQIVTVLGANGAGKTTLAQSISGLVDVTSGSITWNGRDITSTPAHERARWGIAHCQEGRKLFRGLTVRENLELGGFRASKQERAERLSYVYEVFPLLAERQRQVATTMSGGQQQMVAIGRALMLAPTLLLLDEVTLGLSPKAADEIYGAVERISATGTSLLLVEQDIVRSTSVATRAVVLAQGAVVFDDRPSKLTEEQLLQAYLGNSTPTQES
jgi:branched-chain amino acid transport system ATP-binding protein